MQGLHLEIGQGRTRESMLWIKKIRLSLFLFILFIYLLIYIFIYYFALPGHLPLPSAL